MSAVQIGSAESSGQAAQSGLTGQAESVLDTSPAGGQPASGSPRPSNAVRAARRGGAQWIGLVVGLVVIVGSATAYLLAAAPPPTKAPGTPNGAEGTNAGPTSAGTVGPSGEAKQPEIGEAELEGRELSVEERRRILDRARTELTRWQNLRSISDPDARFAYMREMEASMKFFVETRLHNSLFSVLRQQEPTRRNDPVFLVLYGFLTAQSQDPTVQRRALEWLDEAIRLDPRFAYALYVSGAVRVLLQQVRLSRGESSERQQVLVALDHLDRAVRQRPSLADAFRATAMARMMLGEPDPALAAIRRAIDLEPNQEENWSAYIGLLRQRGVADSRAIEELLDSHPTQLSPRLRLAVFGMLADQEMQRNQFSTAYRLLSERLLPLALANPDLLEPHQWRTLYSDTALTAVFKSPSVFALAFDFLDRALAYARQQNLPLFPAVQRYAAIVQLMFERTTPGIDRRARVRGLVEAIFDSLRTDTLGNEERGGLVQMLVTLFSPCGCSTPSSPTPMPTCWRLGCAACWR